MRFASAFWKEVTASLARARGGFMGRRTGATAAGEGDDIRAICRTLLRTRGEASVVTLARAALDAFARLDEAGQREFFRFLGDELGPEAAALDRAVEAYRGGARSGDRDRPRAGRRAAAPRPARPSQHLAERNVRSPRDARGAVGGPAGATGARAARRGLPLLAPRLVQPRVPRDPAHRLAYPRLRARKDHRIRSGAPDPRLGRPAAPPGVGSALFRVLPSLPSRRTPHLRGGGALPGACEFRAGAHLRRGGTGRRGGGGHRGVSTPSATASAASSGSRSATSSSSRWCTSSRSSCRDCAGSPPCRPSPGSGSGWPGKPDKAGWPTRAVSATSRAPTGRPTTSSPVCSGSARAISSTGSGVANPWTRLARFHLRNGARLERLNWMGDPSSSGLAQSGGMMVNYVYDEAEVVANHEAFVNEGRIAHAPAVAALAEGPAAELLPKERNARRLPQKRAARIP